MDFFNTQVSDVAIENAIKVLKSTWLSEGEKVKEFEASLESSIGLLHPVAVNSGTAALHLALAIARIGPGDEVILPAQTFVATGLVILMQGATPVFADIQPETGNISLESIREKITERTRAIMPVHWGGYPCDMDEINALSDEFNLTVIEDAAHALGATYKGKVIGALSRFTAFSFQAIKHLTTGDGGALCSRNDNDYIEAKSRRWFGIDRMKSKPSILGEREYDIDKVGYKYHMNDLSASVGIGNLVDFSKNAQKIQNIAQLYRHELKDIPGLKLLDYKNDRQSAYWLFTVLVEDRENFVRKLQSRGVPSSVVHLRIDHNSVFGGITPDLPNQEWFNDRQISIPIHPGLTENDLGLVVKSIKSGW